MSFSAPAQVQPVNGFGTAVANSPALSATSAGSLIVAEITSQLATGNSVSVTDNIGNTYTMATLANPGTSQKHKEIWYCLSAAAGVTTVTVNNTAGVNVAGSVSVWAGGAASVRAVASLNNSGSTSPPAATVTPVAGDLIIGNMGYLAAVANTRQETLNAGYTLLQATQRGTTTMTSSAYLIATSTTATGPAWTMSPSVSTAEVTVAFAPAAAGGAVLVTPVAGVGTGVMQMPGITTTSSVSGGGPILGTGLMRPPVLNIDTASTAVVNAVKAIGTGLMLPPAITIPGVAPLSFLVEVDFANNGTWTDVTAYVEGMSITRGRTVATNSVDPGTVSVTLDNSTGRFTPGRPASPYYPNVKVNRKVRVSVFTGARTYLITARADSWVTGWQGGLLAVCTLTGTDGFKALARRTSQSLYAETVLTNPAMPNIALYTLSEAAEATSFGDGNPTSNNPPAKLVGSKYGAGVFTAGEGAGFMKGAPKNTHITLSNAQTGGSDAMSVVQFAGGTVTNGPFPPSAGPWTWGCWFRVSNPAAGGYLLYAVSAPTQDPLFARRNVSAELLMLDSGQVQFYVKDRVGTAASTTTNVDYADGQWHYVTASMGADSRTLTLFVDGTAAPAATASTTFLPLPLGWFVAGGNLTQWGVSTYGLVGSLASVELYTAADTAANNQARWKVGRDGFYKTSSTSGLVQALAKNAGQAITAEPGLTLQTANLDTDGMTYLAAMQALTDTEQGVLFMRGDDRLVFKNRYSLVNQASLFTLDNNRGDVNAALQVGVDDQLLLNDYAVTRPDGPVIRVRDAASVAEYGVYTNAAGESGAQTVYAASDPDLTDYAAYRVATYSQPQPRTPTVVVQLTTASDLWPKVVQAEIGTRFTLTNLPPEAPSTTADFVVEQVQWDYDDPSGMWTWTATTSPATDLTHPILTLDRPVFGLLDGTNYLFF